MGNLCCSLFNRYHYSTIEEYFHEKPQKTFSSSRSYVIMRATDRLCGIASHSGKFEASLHPRRKGVCFMEDWKNRLSALVAEPASVLKWLIFSGLIGLIVGCVR